MANGAKGTSPRETGVAPAPQKAHARNSPSSSDRWSRCAGSINACEGIEEQPSVPADEGSVAHELAHLCYEKKVNAGNIGNFLFEEIVDKFETAEELHGIIDRVEMNEHVDEYLGYIRKLAKGADFFKAELKMDLRRWIRDSFGRGDFLALNDRKLHVVDLKYGANVEVGPEARQLRCYGMGGLDLADMLGVEVDTVVTHVHQSRRNNVSSKEYTVPELFTFADKMHEAAELTYYPDAPRTPGDKQCQWCPALGTCAAAAKYRTEQVAMGFEIIQSPDQPATKELLPAVGSMTLAQRGRVQQHIPGIRKWLDEVDKQNKEHVRLGHHLPSCKPVLGRGSRSWSAEDPVLDAIRRRKKYKLSELAKPVTPLTPAQMEKAVGKDEFAEYFEPLVNHKRPNLLVAAESDPRKELPAADYLGFTDLTGKDFDIIEGEVVTGTDTDD